MPYDPQLAERVRIALAGHENVREVRMFGGLAFMVDDRMVVCVRGGDAALLVRVDPASDAQHLNKPGAHRAEMGKGRSMGEGWISVGNKAISTDNGLDYWMNAAIAFHAQGSGKKRR